MWVNVHLSPHRTRDNIVSFHNMTSYSHLQTNVLAKFVDTTCIFRDAGAAVGKQSRRHGIFWGVSPSEQSSKANQI